MGAIIVSLIGLAIGGLILRDANRLSLHVAVAERLMNSGVSEEIAMEQSGCNFWDQPWYMRLTQAYPGLPNK